MYGIVHFVSQSGRFIPLLGQTSLCSKGVFMVHAVSYPMRTGDFKSNNN